MPAIETLALSHYYRLNRAVDQISFQVKEGTVFGLLGPNGAGKTTTIKMLTTLLPPTSGTAKVLGHDIIENPEAVRQKIGYVPQLISADGDLTGYENLVLSANLYGLNVEKREKRIELLLEFMHLKGDADRLVKQYSGGMIRKLEIAQALLHHPKVLFLDEPTVGLDPSAKKGIWFIIDEWVKNYNTTIMMTTHDMNEADKLCDILAFMHQGHVIVMDTPDKLKSTLGGNATLDDVFIHYTGASVNQGNINHVQDTRRTISHLD
jgi:ABC-2 type transport system ATP-binding protein